MSKNNPHAPLLCIDVSYLLFYRINALRTWHKHRTQEDATQDTMCSEAYKATLTERIDRTIQQLCKHHTPRAVVLAYDGHKNWRKQEYKDYKKGRKHESGVLKLFEYGQTHILNHLCTLPCPEHHLHHDALEADDFIHYIARHRTDLTTRIAIIANDHDYLPLLGDTNVRLFNLKAKNNELHLPINTITDERMTGDEYLLYKVLLGDKSDNIPAVFKRCGKKTAMKLVADPQKRQEQFDKGGEEALAKYTHNRLLIDNRCVPEPLQAQMGAQCSSVVEM